MYILDEHPVWTNAGPRKHQRPSWYILTAVEVLWYETEDPFGLPERGSRLRLARAFSRSNADAWQLVLAELGVRPDFVVCDRGSGLTSALKTYYGQSVGVVPSLWHIQKNLREALTELSNTTFLVGSERVLVDALRKHLGVLGRESLLGWTPEDVAQWWQELANIVASLSAPVSSIRALRAEHESRLLEALPILSANPQVPASNAAVESQIRNDLKSFLANRKHLFGNQERTNRLLNLLVARRAGAFSDLDDLALRIRQMNEVAGGWAPAPRQILDKQPPGVTSRTKRYASLKSHSVIGKVAKAKGITTTAQALATAPAPVLSKKRPETVERAPVREWARGLGLPAGETEPIRASVQLAYDVALKGATDAVAITTFERAEAGRLARKYEARKASQPVSGERIRKEELAPIREWAAQNGIEIKRHSAIPKAVLEAYEAARAGRTLRRRPSRLPKKGGS